jgi:hypothetical protein
MTEEQRTSNTSRACCAHLHVSYLTSTVQGITRGWWACDDCDQNFSPMAAPSPYAPGAESTLCHDGHEPIRHFHKDCPLCEVMQRWMDEANAPLTAQPPSVSHDLLTSVAFEHPEGSKFAIALEELRRILRASPTAKSGNES